MKTLGELLYIAFHSNRHKWADVPNWEVQPEDIKKVWEAIAFRYHQSLAKSGYEVRDRTHSPVPAASEL